MKTTNFIDKILKKTENKKNNMQQPILPKPPFKPARPLRTYKGTLRISPRNYGNLAELVQALPKGVPFKDVRIQSEYFGDDVYFEIENTEIEHPQYRIAHAVYKEALLEYEKAEVKYNIALSSYRERKEKYDAWRLKEDIKAAKQLLKKHGQDPLEQARVAKPLVKKAFEKYGKVVGVGITLVGDVPAVKVNLESSTVPAGKLPSYVGDIPVVVDIVGKIRARNGVSKNKSRKVSAR